MRGKQTMALLVKSVAVAVLAGPASAGSANVDVRAHVPATCAATATVISQTEERFNPLVLNLQVKRDCNAAHTLSVTYVADLSNKSSLEMVFGGILPTSSVTGGTVTFANLPAADSTDTLIISYSGPPPERTAIATTIQIAVTVP